jgi:hypothetical protein
MLVARIRLGAVHLPAAAAAVQARSALMDQQPGMALEVLGFTVRSRVPQLREAAVARGRRTARRSELQGALAAAALVIQRIQVKEQRAPLTQAGVAAVLDTTSLLA